MEHFVIYDPDNPAPEPTATHFHYDEGNWHYQGTGNVRVFAFEDNGEALTVHVAAKRRYGSIDDIADDVPFTILRGATI